VSPENRGPHGFAGVRWAWQRLDVDTPYFFQGLEWMDRLCTVVDDEVAWTVAIDAAEPVAVSVVRSSHRRRMGVRLRVLSEVRVGDMGYPYADAVVAPRTNVDFDGLVGISGAWDVLSLRSRRIGSPWVALVSNKSYVEEEPDGGAGILDTRMEADEWWRGLPKNMRDSIRKTRSRIAASGGSEVAVSTGAQLPAAYDEFVTLEASGWKAQEGTALQQRPAWRELLGDYLRVAPTAEVRSLHIGGRLAASQLSVTCGGSLFLLKVAYDEELAHLSPGNVLMASLVEACCQTPGVERIDCLVWQDWHQRWGMTREPTYRVLAFNSHSAKGRAAGVAWKAHGRLKRK
jgi:CelD/BcsL family acetyltransferase involved in cellulose biosynthesis